MCLSSCHTDQCQSKCLQDCAKNDHDVWSCLVANCDWECRCHPPQSYLDTIKQLKESGELSEDGSVYHPKPPTEEVLKKFQESMINTVLTYKLNPKPIIMNKKWKSRMMK